MRTPYQDGLIHQIKECGSVPSWYGSPADWEALKDLVQIKRVRRPAVKSPTTGKIYTSGWTEDVAELSEGVYER